MPLQLYQIFYAHYKIQKGTLKSMIERQKHNRSIDVAKFLFSTPQKMRRVFPTQLWRSVVHRIKKFFLRKIYLFID